MRAHTPIPVGISRTWSQNWGESSGWEPACHRPAPCEPRRQNQRLNRTENVRPIPPSDPDFARLYARRNDAESINRNLEDSLFLGRAHSVGLLRQQVRPHRIRAPRERLDPAPSRTTRPTPRGRLSRIPPRHGLLIGEIMPTIDVLDGRARSSCARPPRPRR